MTETEDEEPGVVATNRLLNSLMNRYEDLRLSEVRKLLAEMDERFLEPSPSNPLMRRAELRLSEIVLQRDAALAREASLRDLLNERDGGNHDADCKALRATGPKLCNCGHDAVVAALAVKP